MTRSDISATTPRSWVINITAVLTRLAQILHQLQNLGLNRDIEGRCRLIEYQKVRIVCKRHRDHDSLSLAAAEVVRVLLEAPLGDWDTHHIQQLNRTRFRPRSGYLAMHADDLRDLIADGVHGIRGGHRFLEHHGDFVSTDLAHLLLGQMSQILSAKHDLARRQSSPAAQPAA